MRIALVTPEFVTEFSYDGGLANYMYRVARTLLFLGHTPVVVTTAGETTQITYDGIPVHRVAVRDAREWKMPLFYKHMNALSWRRYDLAIKLLWQSRVLSKVVCQLHRERPFDIIQYAHLNGVGFFRPRAIPVVVRLSSFTRLCNEKGGYGIPKFYVRQQEWIERHSLQNADGVFGPSRHIGGLMQEILRRPVDVIESPFLLDVDYLDDSVYREHLQRKKYLLFFGSLCHIKGVGIIAAMIHRLLGRHRDIHFAFVGKEIPRQEGGSLLEQVRRNAAGHVDRVIHIGSLRHPQLYPVIRGAHAVILPSRVDNFPNACIEAMAFGRVVVGTFGNGFEQMIKDGRSGFLCRVDDPDHLLTVTEHVLQLTDDERSQIGMRAVRRIDDLAPEKVGKQLVEFYERVISSVRAPVCAV